MAITKYPHPCAEGKSSLYDKYDVSKVNPNKEQYEPRDSNQVRQHFCYAGGNAPGSGKIPKHPK